MPESYSEDNDFDSGLDFQEDMAQAQLDELADRAAEEGMDNDSVDFSSDIMHEASPQKNSNENDPPLSINERKGYRPVRGKKK